MRNYWLASSLLSSCTFLVGAINPCLDGNDKSAAICLIEKPAQSTPGLGVINEIKAGDVDGDGLVDLVVTLDEPDFGRALYVFFQESSGEFTLQRVITLGTITSYDIADLNADDGDARVTIAVLSGGQLSLFSLLNRIPTEGTPILAGDDQAGPLGEFAANVREVAFGDFDANGTQELSLVSLNSSRQGRVTNFAISGLNLAVNFSTGLIDDDINEVDGILSLDAQNFTPNTADEFVVFSLSGTIVHAQLYANNGGAPGGPPHTDLNLGVSTNVQPVSGVLDGSARDLVVVSTDDLLVQVFFTESPGLAPGDLLLTPQQQGAPFQFLSDRPVQAVSIADVDGDSLSDIVLLTAERVEFLLNQGDRTFSVQGHLLLDSSPEVGFLGLFDLNGDGAVEVLVPRLQEDGSASLQIFYSAP